MALQVRMCALVGSGLPETNARPILSAFAIPVDRRASLGAGSRSDSASTADAAFVYIVASQLPVDLPFAKLPFGFLQENTELCLLQINSMNASPSLTRHACPSLLDPTSPLLLPGDLNFQTTGRLPYLYFTQMKPVGSNNLQGWNRDLMRIAVQVLPSRENTYVRR